MTVSYQTAGTVIKGTTSLSMTSAGGAFPSGMANGDMLVLIVVMKPSTANSGSVSTPLGWTLAGNLNSAGGYSTTLGADTGNTHIYAFTKPTTGTESNFTVTLNTSNNGWGQILRYSKTHTYWATTWAGTGSDTTAGNVSIAVTNVAGTCVADDAIAFAMGIPTDAASFSAEAITATGATFGTVTEVADVQNASGNQSGGFVAVCSVTAGSNTAAPTMTATAGGTTTNVRGPGIVVRLRDTESVPTGSISDDFNDNTINTAIWSANVGTVSETGGKASVSSTAISTGTYGTAGAYTFAGSYVLAQVFPGPASGGTRTYTRLSVNQSSPSFATLYVVIDTTPNTIFWTYTESFTTQWTDTVSGGYDSTAHAWVRLRESGGTIYFDTSPDGSTWTNQFSRTTPSAIAGINVCSVALDANVATGSVTSTFDNFNNPPAPAATGNFLPFFM